MRIGVFLTMHSTTVVFAGASRRLRKTTLSSSKASYSSSDTRPSSSTESFGTIDCHLKPSCTRSCFENPGAFRSKKG